MSSYFVKLQESPEVGCYQVISLENRLVGARFIARAIHRRTTTAPAYFHLSAGTPTANEQLLKIHKIGGDDAAGWLVLAVAGGGGELLFFRLIRLC